MATLYADIYNPFLDMITDHKLPKLEETDREKVLLKLLTKSCGKFKRLCKVNLKDRDDIIGVFNNDLDDDIIDIITTGMIVEWLKPRYLDDDNMRNSLNTNDYKLAASPANMMGAIKSAYEMFKKEHEGMMNKYSIIYGKIEDLKP